MDPLPPAMNPPPAAVSASPFAGRALRILYADDLPELRELMSESLSAAGHSIETAADGSEALDRLKQAYSGFDLLITDHHMPGINGLELVRRARLLPYAVKIIVLSSSLTGTAPEDYDRLGVDAIVAKPVSPLAFRSVIEQLFAAEQPGETPGRAGRSAARG